MNLVRGLLLCQLKAISAVRWPWCTGCFAGSFCCRLGWFGVLIQGMPAALIVWPRICGLSSATLHHHHSSEDRYVWPLLEQRAPAQLSEHVTAAMQQHRHVHAVQAQVDAELPIWSCGASADSRERLAGALERLAGALIEHMDYEERNVVPLMETHIGLEEWDQILQTMTAGQDRNGSDALLVLGMTMYEDDKDIIDHTIGNMPTNVRAGIRGTAALVYAEHAHLIHGLRPRRAARRSGVEDRHGAVDRVALSGRGEARSG